MRLEDAALYLQLDRAPSAPADAASLVRAAIAGGADVIQMPGTDGMAAETHAAIVAVCREDDALVLVADDCAAAIAAQADGVVLSGSEGSLGQARASLGMTALVGMQVGHIDEAGLALEVGVDFLIYVGGTATPGAFAMLAGAAGNILYAGGLDGPDAARAVVAGGVYRLCVAASRVQDGNVAENVAAYSRILGRCL